jgi:hypothetical protein
MRSCYSPDQAPKTIATPTVGCLWLFSQYIPSYPAYIKADSSILYPMMLHVLVTGTQLFYQLSHDNEIDINNKTSILNSLCGNIWEGVFKSFRNESISKYTLTAIKTRWEATQRVMAAKLTRLTHKIGMKLHVVAESCIICSSRSRRPVRKLLDTLSYKTWNKET